MTLIINLRVIASILILVSPALAQDSRFCDDEDCCVDLNEATLLGDWHDCKMYFQCFGGIPFYYTCSTGTPYFNPDSKQCETDIPNGCVGGTRGTGSPVTSTTVSPIGTGNPVPSTTVSPIDGNCTEEGGYNVPYPGDCKKYMVCNGVILYPEVHECPPGTRFDPILKECNLESLVECKPTCPETGTINLPYDGNCSLYWQCASGEATLKTCPLGLVFDTVLETCNIKDAVLCPNSCPINGTVNLPHSSNSSLYWLCTSGVPTLKNCPAGLIFDPSLGQCNIAPTVPPTTAPPTYPTTAASTDPTTPPTDPTSAPPTDPTSAPPTDPTTPPTDPTSAPPTDPTSASP